MKIPQNKHSDFKEIWLNKYSAENKFGQIKIRLSKKFGEIEILLNKNSVTRNSFQLKFDQKEIRSN